jgi:hypothetical protein
MELIMFILYDFDMEWVNSRVHGSKKVMDTFSMSGIVDQFEGYEGGDLADADSIRNMEEGDYLTEWKNFLNEGDKDVVGVASSILRDMPNLDVYIDSLKNDIRLNGPEDY